MTTSGDVHVEELLGSLTSTGEMTKKRILDVVDIGNHEAELKSTKRARTQNAKQTKLPPSNIDHGDHQTVPTSATISPSNLTIKNELPQPRKTRKRKKESGAARQPGNEVIHGKKQKGPRDVQKPSNDILAGGVEHDIETDLTKSTANAEQASQKREAEVKLDDQDPDHQSQDLQMRDTPHPPQHDAAFKLRRKEAKKARRQAAREARLAAAEEGVLCQKPKPNTKTPENVSFPEHDIKVAENAQSVKIIPSEVENTQKDENISPHELELKNNTQETSTYGLASAADVSTGDGKLLTELPLSDLTTTNEFHKERSKKKNVKNSSRSHDSLVLEGRTPTALDGSDRPTLLFTRSPVHSTRSRSRARSNSTSSLSSCISNPIYPTLESLEASKDFQLDERQDSDNKSLSRSNSKTRRHTSKLPRKPQSSAKSPYFPKPPIKRIKREQISCIPFPPLDSNNFGLVQESLCHDPFKLFIAVIFLNKTRGAVAMPVFYKLISQYPTAASLAAANEQDIVSIFAHLGLQNQRARKCIGLAKTWLANPPVKGKRYRRLHYPLKGDGRDISVTEGPLSDEDARVAWEVGHLVGIGSYGIDSWRIFCRDELRGVVVPSYGGSALPSLDELRHVPEVREAELAKEWTRVLPLDKELRAYLRWRWLRVGFEWDCATGERKVAGQKVLEEVKDGGVIVYEGRDGCMVEGDGDGKEEKEEKEEEKDEEKEDGKEDQHSQTTSKKPEEAIPVSGENKKKQPHPKPRKRGARKTTPPSLPPSSKPNEEKPNL